MKLVLLICLFLCSTLTESRLLQKRDEEHHSRHIGDIYKTVGEETFNHLTLIILTQNLQKCSLEQLNKEKAEINKFAKHCVDHADEAECKKPVTTLFYDHICQIKHIDHEYPWTTECCAKNEQERYKCFVEHRDAEVKPYDMPGVDEMCKHLKENPKQAFEEDIYIVSRRHSALYPPTVLGFVMQYTKLGAECCAADDKSKCFHDRIAEVDKKTYYVKHVEQQTCRMLKEFQERVTQAYTLVKVTQKYPAATFEDVQKLTNEIVHLKKDCCHGDMVECMLERMELTQHICEHHEKISSNLKACCERPLVERTSCLMALPHGDVPSDLPKEMTEFVEDEHVCKHYEEQKDLFLARFTYEFTRRHPDLSILSDLRVAKGYQGLLQKCCVTEHPVECYKTAPQMLETAIKAAHALEKANCELFEKKGLYFFQLHLIYRYATKMPQITDETLLEITGKMAKIAGKCCALPEDQRIPCAENKLDLLLGDMCERQSQTPVNEHVTQCCKDSYSDRRPCFTNLGPDTSFKPSPLDEHTFEIGAEICDAPEDQQQTKKKILLAHLMRQKVTLQNEKVEELINEFAKVTKKCCEAADHKACFDLEKPILLAHVKAEIGH
ncbi:serum albumin-like [Pseudophryne corroboree]|uniref:serum albumin-like n=1 Tax=Pseudophryne corroboree TaxID=495146 RepID=UPI0030817CB9